MGVEENGATAMSDETVPQSDDQNPYAGIADACDNSWHGTGGGAPLTIDAMKLLTEALDKQPRQPRYEVVFCCSDCKRSGYATGPVFECPNCKSKEVLNGDRGWPQLGMRKLSD
jgi:hypothetical protein